MPYTYSLARPEPLDGARGSLSEVEGSELSFPVDPIYLIF
jgi:hypothetical protein